MITQNQTITAAIHTPGGLVVRVEGSLLDDVIATYYKSQRDYPKLSELQIQRATAAYFSRLTGLRFSVEILTQVTVDGDDQTFINQMLPD